MNLYFTLQKKFGARARYKKNFFVILLWLKSLVLYLHWRYRAAAYLIVA